MSNTRRAKVVVDMSEPSRDGITYLPGSVISYPVMLRSGLTVYVENAMGPVPYFSMDPGKCCCLGPGHSPDCAQYVPPRPSPYALRRAARRRR